MRMPIADIAESLELIRFSEIGLGMHCSSGGDVSFHAAVIQPSEIEFILFAELSAPTDTQSPCTFQLLKYIKEWLKEMLQFYDKTRYFLVCVPHAILIRPSI